MSVLQAQTAVVRSVQTQMEVSRVAATMATH